MTNNDGGGLDSLVHPNDKESSLAGQKFLYDGNVLLGSLGPSKDGTELLLHDVDYWELREDRQLSTTLIESGQVAAF